MNVRWGWAAAMAMVVLAACSTGAQVASPACGSGSSQCGASCTNTQIDPANCGACGVACKAGEVCSAGVCATSCGPGATKCGASCTNTQVDPANCGACGTLCAPGQVCSVGACGLTCGGGTTRCGNLCVSTQLDPANCGACGNACKSGEVCSNGTCGLSCYGGTTACQGVCANTQTDPTNCGSCGKVCGPGLVCAAGTCALQCVGGSTDCNGTCTNTQVDPTNCGTCGKQCVGYETCQTGKCAVPLYTSCNEILKAGKSYGNAYYEISPTGNVQDKVTVWCDMKTDSGGWTRVFIGAANLNSSSLGYQTGTLQVVSASAEMLFAFADEGSMTLVQPWKFSTPQPFKSAAPMAGGQCGYVALTPTRLADNSSINTTLRYGWGSFGSLCDQGCSGQWGQICLKSSVNQGTAGGYSDFPMYTGYATGTADNCTRSDEAYTTTACTTSREFTILVR